MDWHLYQQLREDLFVGKGGDGKNGSNSGWMLLLRVIIIIRGLSVTSVPVSAHQVVLSCAFLNPDARPRLNGRRSASTVLSQVCLGRPRRRFQFLGVCHMHVRRALEWSWDLSARATWPNSLRRLAHTISDYIRIVRTGKTVIFWRSQRCIW